MDKKQYRKEFFDTLILARTKQGMNRNQVGIKTGISPSHVKEIEKGDRNSTIEIVLKFINSYGCKLVINNQIIWEESELRMFFKMQRVNAINDKLKSYYGVGNASGINPLIVKRSEETTMTVDTFLALSRLFNVFYCIIPAEGTNVSQIYVFEKKDGSLYLSESEESDSHFSRCDRIEAIFDVTGVRLSEDLSSSEVKKYVSDHLYGTRLWGNYQKSLIKQFKFCYKIEVILSTAEINNSEIIKTIKMAISTSDFQNSGNIEMMTSLGIIGIRRI